MQFSLRTVLVLVTVLCVTVGLWIVPLDAAGGGDD
jgi:hypothetical protein